MKVYWYADGWVIRQFSGPKIHLSEGSLVRRIIGAKTVFKIFGNFLCYWFLLEVKTKLEGKTMIKCVRRETTWKQNNKNIYFM